VRANAPVGDGFKLLRNELLEDRRAVIAIPIPLKE